MYRLMLTILAFSSSPSHGQSMAVIGDSLSSGAATHESLHLDSDRLLKVIEKKALVGDPAKLGPRPPFLGKSLREYQGGWQWFETSFRHFFGNRFLNTPQLSWGYLLGEKLGVPVENRWLAANNGARAESTAAQVQRVLSASSGVIPDKVFVFFSGNDLCGQQTEGLTSPADYGSSIESGLRHLATKGQVPASGADIYLIGHLGIMQLGVNPDILDKKVYAYGKTLSCRQLREMPPTLPDSGVNLISMLVPHPGNFCPTAFGPEEKLRPLRIRLTNLISGYRKQLEDRAKSLQEWSQSKGLNLRFHHISSTEKLLFDGEDIAQDCFHLSALGQRKVLATVQKELRP